MLGVTERSCCCREPGQAEKMLIADMVSKLDEASKLLGQAYGTLVLGIGLEPVHHMRCGRLVHHAVCVDYMVCLH